MIITCIMNQIVFIVLGTLNIFFQNNQLTSFILCSLCANYHAVSAIIVATTLHTCVIKTISNDSLMVLIPVIRHRRRSNGNDSSVANHVGSLKLTV